MYLLLRTRLVNLLLSSLYGIICFVAYRYIPGPQEKEVG